MKNFHQNLLIALALCLCALCAWQWYGQTLQRSDFDKLNAIANQKSALIQDYTNSIAMMQHQIGQMDASITELKGTIAANNETILAQRRELNQSEAENTALINEIAEYKQGGEKLEARLKEAYDGIKKQNDALKQLAGERDEFVKKYNDIVIERNNIVSNYNDLAARFKELQSGSGK
jgi:chromosome segregation ATPase